MAYDGFKGKYSLSFKQDLIRNRLGPISQKYNHGLYNRMNTYNIGNK